MKNLSKQNSSLFKKGLATLLVLALFCQFAFAQLLINENLNGLASIPTGWVQKNQSFPLGTSPFWRQGDPGTFYSYSGEPQDYISVNFNSIAGTGTISNWLISPVIDIKNGDRFSFYTRTTDSSAIIFSDRLQVRMSTSDTSLFLGINAGDAGDFTRLLLDINPTYTTTGYPSVWTLQTITITGVTGTVRGRIALRYFVFGGGPTNTSRRSDYIGIDDIKYDSSPCNNTPAATPIVTASSTSVCAGTAVTITPNANLNNSENWIYYTGSCGGTFIGRGSTLTVNPTVTTTYFVRGENGCGTTVAGACGSITVNVVPCACMSPSVATICDGTIQKLSVAATAFTNQTFANPTPVPIVIPSIDIASPYPSNLTVSGLPNGTRVKSITLNGVTHTNLRDVDVALVSPQGTPVVFMSDAGATGAVSNLNFTFSDAATATMPTTSNSSGTFLPTNVGPRDNFPAPGPGFFFQPTATLSTFTGNMNGVWKLYVVDDTQGDQGSITNWSITFDIPPTATWTGSAGTMFSDANATVPYAAGTLDNTIWVKPSTTSTYTATLTSGTCVGANNVTVNVLPKPTIGVNNTNGCAPLSVTANGAPNYVWSPQAGLTNPYAATVTANPSFTTNYTVSGLGANGCFSTPIPVTVQNTLRSATIAPATTPAALLINEGFDTVNNLYSNGWAKKNNSVPLGTNDWFQGLPLQSRYTAIDSVVSFYAYDGVPNSFLQANFNNTTSNGTISNWMFTPVVSIKNGDVFTFYTQTVLPISASTERPDRLQLRMSLNNSSTDVGTTATSVGDFSTLLVEINPDLARGVYPKAYTKYTATVSGIVGTQTGRFAFRYFVTNGGNSPAVNSNNIAIDRVQFGTPGAITSCANGVANIKVNVNGGTSPYTVVYSNGTSNTTVNNYVNGRDIPVTPTGTTTYNLVSVQDASGCNSLSNLGTAIINIANTVAIASQPINKTVTENGNTFFSVVTNNGLGNIYQWQVNTVPSPGTPVWTDIASSTLYQGTSSDTLRITNATLAMRGYTYRVNIRGYCAGNVNSNAATLTVSGTATNDPTEVKAENAFLIYPVPNDGTFQVRLYNDNTNADRTPETINVYDARGAKIYTKSCGQMTTGINVLTVNLPADHASGIYMVDLIAVSGKRIKAAKVLIE
jgi:subtilisin-like proprotein convertase family protein